MTMIKLYPVARSKVLRTCVAVLCSFTFWAATNYCNLEALAAHPAQGEDSGQHHPAAGHHPGAVPTPDDEDSLCCATLHAVPVTKVDMTPKSLSQWIDPVTVVLGRDVLTTRSRSTIGWSPPERGPTPEPFYRTTYANHAPPVFLPSLTL